MAGVSAVLILLRQNRFNMPRVPPTAFPAVTVVIPAWNASLYVRQAVESVLAQTHGDVEIVVVDDGSTDNTREVVRAVADPRVRLLTQNQEGPSAARNRGVDAARASKYIAFLDADDCWDPDKLERQTAYLDRHSECGALGSLMRYISSSGGVLGQAGEPIHAADRERIARGELFPFQLSSLVVRRSAFEHIGGFDEALGRLGSEDLDLVARLAEIALIATMPVVLGSYRVHPASAMAKHRRQINRAARFVRARQAARRSGGDLTWESFSDTTVTTWRERHQDAVESCYRAAALWHAEGRTGKAVWYGLIAAGLNPRYTLARAYRQRAVLFTPATGRTHS